MDGVDDWLDPSKTCLMLSMIQPRVSAGPCCSGLAGWAGLAGSVDGGLTCWVGQAG